MKELIKGFRYISARSCNSCQHSLPGSCYCNKYKVMITDQEHRICDAYKKPKLQIYKKA